ncbi:hypothetical protein [Holdemanella biformis]|mgnify:FL=1|uniref:hypothetical protein n=1 Tax=Holdemanella biformis TaxID=1735 RepID=UPI002666423D|nr:hypothetical protein [Holdemanella biformis]
MIFKLINLNEVGYIFALSMQIVASFLLFRNVFKGRNVIVKEFFRGLSLKVTLDDILEYDESELKESFLEVYSNNWALLLFIIGNFLGMGVDKGDLNTIQITIYVFILSFVLYVVISILFVNVMANKKVSKKVTCEELEKLGVISNKNCIMKENVSLQTQDEISCDSIGYNSGKNSKYIIKLNRALTLYKSIEYSDENHIKNVNLYRKIKFKVRQFYMTYKVAIIHLILTFIMFRMVVYIYAGVDDPKLETTFSVFVFTLVLRMFDISFGKADEGVHRVSKVEKELYEIALDIYDQLCLDQDDQDKRELKDYMERRFLNQK